MWGIKNKSWTAAFAVLFAFSGLAACTHTPPSRQGPSQPQAERSASPIGNRRDRRPDQAGGRERKGGTETHAQTVAKWSPGTRVSVFRRRQRGSVEGEPSAGSTVRGRIRSYHWSAPHPDAPRSAASSGFVLYPRHERHAAQITYLGTFRLTAARSLLNFA